MLVLIPEGVTFHTPNQTEEEVCGELLEEYSLLLQVNIWKQVAFSQENKH